MSGKYDDMLFLPHPVSKKHPPMSNLDRAAQFSPFAALTGYDDAIRETARVTDTAVCWDEGGKLLLDEKLQLLFRRVVEQPTVRLTYFEPDSQKAGGAYISITAPVKKVDRMMQVIVLSDGRQIPFDRLYDLEIAEENPVCQP